MVCYGLRCEIKTKSPESMQQKPRTTEHQTVRSGVSMSASMHLCVCAMREVHRSSASWAQRGQGAMNETETLNSSTSIPIPVCSHLRIIDAIENERSKWTAPLFGVSVCSYSFWARFQWIWVQCIKIPLVFLFAWLRIFFFFYYTTNMRRLWPGIIQSHHN